MRLHRDLWLGDERVGVLTLTTATTAAHAMLDQQKMEELMSCLVILLQEKLPEVVGHANPGD